MARTESVSFQVHPNNEQAQIDLMQKFHWSLLNSQEIKTIDNHLERRGDDIYQVSSSEHYVKLTFNRELDLPNLNDIKRLEQQYNSLPYPTYPKLFPISIWVWIILAFVYGLGVVGWILYFILSYKPKKEEADNISISNSRKRQEILTELEKYD
ncbi:MAG: hypothetical protein FD122_2358 [Stygiobacter sp.]|nr:MAG: hypothetical protein FD122_2358 [Stygiobacter sp.]KAF0211403.1 MAG: hypothetical protein FD178_3440 [Ignavibacteria bacterium]